LRKFLQVLFAVTWVFEYSTQHSAYVKDWLEVLKEDKKAIFRASSQAQKATQFILRELQEAP